MLESEAALGGYVIFWVLGSIFVAAIAEATNREIGFGGGIVTSLLLSPFAGIIFVATSRKRDDVKRDKAILDALQRIAAAYPELPQSATTPSLAKKKEISQEGIDSINKLGQKLSEGKITQVEYDTQKAQIEDRHGAL
jgi:hypothetical protein